MRKALFLSLSLCVLTAAIPAQGQPFSVLSPGGATWKGAEISLDWTLGEPAIQTLSTPTGQLAEGFHQPILSLEKVPEKAPEIRPGQFQAFVSPNPARSFLSIRIESSLEGNAVIGLLDFQGRPLKRATTSLYQRCLEWDINTLPAAVYNLSFRTQEGELLQTVKVVKMD